MSELEIVLSIACAVLFVAWRHATVQSKEHHEAACLFRLALKKTALKQATLSYDEREDKLEIKPTATHDGVEL